MELADLDITIKKSKLIPFESKINSIDILIKKINKILNVDDIQKNYEYLNWITPIMNTYIIKSRHRNFVEKFIALLILGSIILILYITYIYYI